MHCVNLLHSGLGRESPVLLLSVIKIKTVLSYLDHICNVFDPHTGPVQFFAFKKCELCKYFKKEKIRFIKTIFCKSFCFESIFTRKKVNVKVILPQN